MRSLEKNVQSERRGPGQGTNIYKRMQKEKKKSLQEQLEKQEATGKCGPKGARKSREVGRLVVIDATELSCIKSIEKHLLKKCLLDL